jgi:hypothetical protein
MVASFMQLRHIVVRVPAPPVLVRRERHLGFAGVRRRDRLG